VDIIWNQLHCRPRAQKQTSTLVNFCRNFTSAGDWCRRGSTTAADGFPHGKLPNLPRGKCFHQNDKIHKTQNVPTKIKFVYFMQVEREIYTVSVTNSGQFKFLWQCTSPNASCRMLMWTWKQYLNINHTSCRFVNWSIQLSFSLSLSFFSNFFHLKTRGIKLRKIIAHGLQKLQITPKEWQRCILHHQFSPVSRLSWNIHTCMHTSLPPHKTPVKAHDENNKKTKKGYGTRVQAYSGVKTNKFQQFDTNILLYIYKSSPPPTPTVCKWGDFPPCLFRKNIFKKVQGTHTVVQVTLLLADHKEQSLVTTYRQQHYFSHDWPYFTYVYSTICVTASTSTKAYKYN